MKKTIALIMVLVISVSTVLISCDNSKKIIGEWVSADSLINVNYVFNEDSTGSMTAFGVTVDIKYTYADDTLVLTYNIMSIDTTEVYSVSFTEDGHLILTDDDGSSEEYLKK